MALGEEQRETALARALREGEFVVSVQLDPPLGGSARGLVEAAHELQRGRRPVRRRQRQRDGPGADELADGLGADRARRRARDRPAPDDRATRRCSASSRCCSARTPRACGTSSRSPATRRSQGDYPGSRGVYEVDAIGLTQLITRLNRGVDFHGRAIDAPTSFFPGVAVNPTADDLEQEAERFRRKVEAGAKFAMTQIALRPRRASTVRRACSAAGRSRCSSGIFPLTSHRLALRLHNEMPGIVVPEHVAGALPRSAGRTRRRSASSSRRS